MEALTEVMETLKQLCRAESYLFEQRLQLVLPSPAKAVAKATRPAVVVHAPFRARRAVVREEILEALGQGPGNYRDVITRIHNKNPERPLGSVNSALYHLHKQKVIYQNAPGGEYSLRPSLGPNHA